MCIPEASVDMTKGSLMCVIFAQCEWASMGMSDLPAIYAQSLMAQPEDCGHTLQANHKCPCYS